jgi:hypothetical protein
MVVDDVRVRATGVSAVATRAKRDEAAIGGGRASPPAPTETCRIYFDETGWVEACNPPCRPPTPHRTLPHTPPHPPQPIPRTLYPTPYTPPPLPHPLYPTP